MTRARLSRDKPLGRTAHPSRGVAKVARVTAPAAESLRRGHPWVWRDSLAGVTGAETADVVPVTNPNGETIGHGVYDDDSPIAVRLWARDGRAVDATLYAERVDRALDARQALARSDDTTAYRLLHGEGDRTPGYVADRYGSVVVLKADGPAATRRVGDFAKVAWPLFEARGMTVLAFREQERGKPPTLTTLAGNDPPASVDVVENGMTLRVDLLHGQKTGAFLDQRDNRNRVRAMADGRKVLNLFSYTGGFSLAAALGGASRTTSVDVAAKAHADAQSSFRLSGVDLQGHEFVTSDVYAFLDRAKAKGELYDLVVCDPPSFAPNERSLPRALAAYRKLHRACADVLASGGTFCAASCSSHVDAKAFLSTLDDVTLGTDKLSVRSVYGAPCDHPTLAAFPEGQYLKFVVLA